MSIAMSNALYLLASLPTPMSLFLSNIYFPHSLIFELDEYALDPNPQPLFTFDC